LWSCSVLTNNFVFCWSRQNKITTGRNTKLLVKTEQDHHWKEHKVVGQDRTRSQLEGTQSCW
jgi:hypothetical protein